MRVTTDLWVSALLRRVFGAGGFAAVVKRGATEAGAVFVLARTAAWARLPLFGPAPQTSYNSAQNPTTGPFSSLFRRRRRCRRL